MSERYFAATLRLILGHGTGVRAEFREVVFVSDDKDVARNAPAAAMKEFEKTTEAKKLFIRGSDIRGLRLASPTEIAAYEARNLPSHTHDGIDSQGAVEAFPRHDHDAAVSSAAKPVKARKAAIAVV